MSKNQIVGRVGVDIGGTFTDAAAIGPDGKLLVGKTLTTPRREVDGILVSIRNSGVDLTQTSLLVHGTTMVINALLERRGVKAALVTTDGFADILSLARGNRPEPYNPIYLRDKPLVPRKLRFELQERISSQGNVVKAPTDEEIDTLAATLKSAGVEAVAVAFLNAYKNPQNEIFVAERLTRLLPGIFVTRSSEISSQWREYERFTTASANAYVGPLVRNYTDKLSQALREEKFDGDILFLDAGGGAVGTKTIQKAPIRLIESGPVGGVIASANLAHKLGFENIVTLDIGGTTAKACLIEGGFFETLDEYWIGGYEKGLPVQVPVIDIHEVGAGGGSIAAYADGRLTVGPQSAGAVPGPAAYGSGGEQPTITDALTYCGRIHPDCFLADISISPELARLAIDGLAKKVDLTNDRLALGILELGSASVAAAVRRQTLERGRDPGEFVMVISGGAGPALACEIAELVGVNRIILPPSPGHFSAIGMLQADLRFSQRVVFARALQGLSKKELQDRCEQMATEISDVISQDSRLAGSLSQEYFATLRYVGQDHTLRIPLDNFDVGAEDNYINAMKAKFFDAYLRRYAYLDEDSPVELMDLEVAVQRDLPKDINLALRQESGSYSEKTIQCLFDEATGYVKTRAMHRSLLEKDKPVAGAAIIYEAGSICVVHEGWTAELVDEGCVLISRKNNK